MSSIPVRVFGIFVTVLFTNTIAHTIVDMKTLIEDKTKTYNKKLRPVFNQSDAVYVGVYFELVSIQEFDEVAEKFSVVAFLIMGWNDQLLAWDPEDYGNMTEFTTEGGDFWRPNLVLINPHDKIEVLGNEWDIFRYYADGTTSVAPGSVFDASCSVDVTHYPWDEQTCSLMFTPWGYNAREVHIVELSETVGTTFYGGNGAWDLVETSSESFQDALDSSLIMFTMRLRRKPRFILVNVILPIVFMSFLNMVVFLIPTSSGERISYCLTVLLAMAVFLTLVGDNLPKKSNPMSILSYYLLGVLVVSVCIVLATVFSLRIYFRDEKKSVSKWLTTFVRCMGCKCKREIDSGYEHRSPRERRSNYEPSDDHTHRYRNRRETGNLVTNDLPVIYRNHGNWRNDNGIGSHSHVSSKYMYQEGISKKRTKTTLSDEEEDKVTWKDVSCAVDMVFFVVFVCSMTVISVVFLAMMINNTDEDTWQNA